MATVAESDLHCERQDAVTKDFDLHGLVGVRVLGARARDLDVVTRQLGPIERPLDRQPEIVIRFTPRLELNSPMRLLGAGEAGFTDEAFVILRGKHKSRIKVQVPFDQLGGACEFVCESGAPAVPLLIPTINLTALARGATPLHASAFTYRGQGVLVTGWAKGGKTETLLGFMAHGAEYVGDEWIYLDPAGERMYGVPEPIRIWDWHLTDLPAFRRRLRRTDRLRMRGLGLATACLERAGAHPWGRLLGPVRALRRLAPLVERQCYVQAPPRRLFGDGGSGPLSAPLDRVIFVLSHDAPETTVEPADCRDIAARMCFSLQQERMNLLASYQMFRFAFPDRTNDLLERVNDLEREQLVKALGEKEAYLVRHPYPVSPVALFEAIRPLL